MKTQEQEPVKITGYKLESLGHNIRLKPLPGGKCETFKGFQSIVDHLNKYQVQVQNPEILPPFYRIMLKNQ